MATSKCNADMCARTSDSPPHSHPNPPSTAQRLHPTSSRRNRLHKKTSACKHTLTHTNTQTQSHKCFYCMTQASLNKLRRSTPLKRIQNNIKLNNVDVLALRCRITPSRDFDGQSAEWNPRGFLFTNASVRMSRQVEKRCRQLAISHSTMSSECCTTMLPTSPLTMLGPCVIIAVCSSTALS